MLVIHRAVTARDRFNFIVKIDQNFVKRQFAVQHYAPRIERLGVIHLPALFQNELEDVANILVRTKHVSLYNRLSNFPDQTRIGQMRRVIDRHRLAPGGFDFVNDARTRRDNVHVVFPA